MDDEFFKRNTDCVYFLASPFTCKKGVECEYRHSEMARLNPRDCWYWLSGTCLNDNCRFRHPPLEVHKEGFTEAAVSMSNHSSVNVPTTKTTVPCYYYYSTGFCKEGDRCPFLHEPVNTSTSIPVVGSAAVDAPMAPSNIKTSGRSDTGPTPEEKHLSGRSLSEMGMVRSNGLEVRPKQVALHSAAENDLDLKSHVEKYVPQSVVHTAVKSPSLEPDEELTKSGCEPSTGSDQSSEDLIDGTVVRDEWWDSSPGFDVLVDGQTEDGGYEDELEYMLPHRQTEEDHDSLFLQLQHECVGPTEYDRELVSSRFYEGSEYVEGEYTADIGRFSPRGRLDRNARHGVAQKRKYHSAESPVGCSIVDLRDYLRNRRLTDQYLSTHDLRCNLVHKRDVRQERPRSHASNQRLRGRLGSKVERNGTWLDQRRASVTTPEQRGRLRNSQHNGSRRLHHSAEGQPRSHFKRQRLSMMSTSFSGPKRLSEIKEHRRRGHNSKNGLEDFDGPKPLSVILKEKKKSTSTEDGSITGCC